MKKFIAVILSALMLLSIAGCSKKEEAPVYKTGVGIIITASTQDATSEKDGKVEINTNMVVATFDKDGKVVSATVDVAQQSGKVSRDGKVVGDIDTRTKIEKGDDYGMKKYSGIGKEIGEEYAALADWFVGKTVDEIMATELTDGHAPEGSDLAASATIGVETYFDCLKLAYESATECAGIPVSTGLGTDITTSVRDASDEKAGQIEVDTAIVASSFDKDGKIVWFFTDVAQQRAGFDTKGAFTGEVDTRTKIGKGDDYGMRKASGLGKEVGEELQALAAWMIGKTADEFAENLEIRDNGSMYAKADTDLAAGTTVHLQETLNALLKAIENAKPIA